MKYKFLGIEINLYKRPYDINQVWGDLISEKLEKMKRINEQRYERLLHRVPELQE